MKTERKWLIGAGIAFLALLVFILWPRSFQPPLLGLGKPVWEGPFGATYRYTYNVPGDYVMYSQNAGNQLIFRGYKRRGNYFVTFGHPDGSLVMIYPGKWQPAPSMGGLVNTTVPGWVTVTCETPPDRWQQLWWNLTARFRSRPTVSSRRVP